MSTTKSCNQEELFNQFHKSTDFLEILKIFQSLCSELGLDCNGHSGWFYPLLREKLTAWRTRALYPLLNARAALPEYEGQQACRGKRVLIIGGGPVGLRAAIEAALLGASVDVVEKRTEFSRNNCLHLWPFVVTDLRNLGAKVFYSKFASGGIDHICIRILQTILLKICLMLGVKVHPGVTFESLVEPADTDSGWSAAVSPASSPVSSVNYDIILAADGKKNSLPGFHLKEFRAKLALAITANFVRHNTRAESVIPELGGVTFMFKQQFFKDMAKELNIDLENIVYFKDEMHYFVMTAKKQSLLKRGVLRENCSDPNELLARENIDRDALEKYAVDAATFSTKGGLGELEFVKNHRGENDVALFDFTSMFASENASRIVERKGKKLLLCVAGDSLIEPFWPTGSGCARGFLGAFDAAWMMKRFSAGVDPVELLKEREAILTLLPQTWAGTLKKDITKYTIDPTTRYGNVRGLSPLGDVSHLYDKEAPSVVSAVTVDSDDAVQLELECNSETELDRAIEADPTETKPRPIIGDNSDTLTEDISTEIIVNTEMSSE